MEVPGHREVPGTYATAAAMPDPQHQKMGWTAAYKSHGLAAQGRTLHSMQGYQ